LHDNEGVTDPAANGEALFAAVCITQGNVLLYAHIWNEDRRELTRSAHWGVGNGWAAAGITRVIRTLPESRAHERQMLEAHFREIIDGCLAHKSQDGLFHDRVDQPETFVKTNLAQMLAYSIYRGIVVIQEPPLLSPVEKLVLCFANVA